MALAQLAQSKEQELSNARESWQRKVEDLLEQVRLPRLYVDVHPGIILFSCGTVKQERMVETHQPKHPLIQQGSCCDNNCSLISVRHA